MQDFIIQWMERFGYWGIGFLIAVENVFPPIPSEVILTFGGVMTVKSDLGYAGVVLAATIGAVLGALVLYAAGRFFSKERMGKWLDGKAGRVLRLKSADVEKAALWFERRGKYTVLFCRFIPVVRSLISIPAGMAKMNLGLFLLLTGIGSAVWNAVLVFLGRWAGDSWEIVMGYIKTYSNVVLLVLLLAAVVLAVYIARRKMRK